MAVILPVIFYAVLTLRIYLNRTRSFSFCLLAAAVAMATGTVALTELLSLFKWISYPVLVACWLLGCGAVCWKFPKPQASQSFSLPKIEKTFLFMAVAVGAFVVLPVTLTAIKAAPGTWDSMTYHLARVEHWVQNKSIVFYPTNIERQLWKDYGGEIFILHLRILSGAGRLCNMVQLLAWFGCMVAACAMLEIWKQGRWEKLMAMVLIATVPMSILQASSTQVDLIGSFWLMAFVYFLMDYLEKPEKTVLILCGLGLGLSLLTRETNYLYVWPFGAWLALALIKREKWDFLKVLTALSVIAAAVVLVNAGHYARNILFYHRILSPGGEDLVNEHWTLGTLLVNALRNTFMHITTPFIPVNDRIQDFLEHWTRAMGLNIQDTSSMVTDRFTINALFLDEDYAQNPLHLFLLLVLMLYTAKRWIFRERLGIAGPYMLALIVGMATFCLVLKWQPWHSRLHLSIFILSAVPAAVMLTRLPRWAKMLIMMFFIMPSLLWVFRNDNRPLIGPGSIWRTDRHQQYYQKQPMTAVHDKTASEIFKRVSCAQIGLVFGENSWEYPFWVLMRETQGDQVRIEHVAVDNPTSRLSYPLGDFSPCGLYMHPSDDRKVLEIGGRIYARVWETSPPDGTKSAVFLPLN